MASKTAPCFTASSRGLLSGAGLTCRCAFGRGGIVPAAQKREGDGASPAGIWAMKRVFYRPDRYAQPATSLPTRPLRATDGWCDMPGHAQYNRLITLPFAGGCEKLWRDDHLYDVVVDLAFNDDPVVAGRGSAIFLHLARPGYTSTQGCIGVAYEDMLAILALSRPGTNMIITL